MLRAVSVLGIAVVLAQPAFSYNSPNKVSGNPETIPPVPFFDEETGKSGYRAADGTVVIPAQFDEARCFHEGLAIVGRLKKPSEHVLPGNCRFGFIDMAGRVVVDVVYEEVWPFSNGFAAVKAKSGMWGCVSKSGKIVIPPQYEIVGEFSCGLAPIMEDWKWGYVDQKGKLVVPFRFLEANQFSEGLASVQVEVNETVEGDKTTSKLWGFIDTTGDFRIPPQYDKRPGDFSEGLASVHMGDRWVFVNHRGEVAFERSTYHRSRFSEGLASACVAGPLGLKSGFIDKSGAWIINPRFGSVGVFKNGLAPASLGGRGKCGLINSGGDYVIPPKYQKLYSMGDGEWLMKTFHGGRVLLDAWGNQTVLEADKSNSAEGPVVEDDAVGKSLDAILKQHGKPSLTEEFALVDAGHTPLRRSLRSYFGPEQENIVIKEVLYQTAYEEDGQLRHEQWWFWFAKDDDGSWKVVTNVFKPGGIAF